MASKACRNCKSIYEGSKCPLCGSAESLDTFKGRITVLNPEESELAKKLELPKKGTFAIRLK